LRSAPRGLSACAWAPDVWRARSELEGGKRSISVLTLSTIRRGLTEAGVEFTSAGAAGVKLEAK
jgi:hypothetical protein